MARRCRPPLAFAFAAGTLLAAAACGMSGARAQTSADDTDRLLLSPRIDGDPRTQRFVRPGAPTVPPADSRIGAIPNYGYQPGVGAGVTGFNSTNPAKKGKAAPKGKAGPTTPAATSIGTNTAPAGMAAATTAATRPAPPGSTSTPGPVAVPPASPDLSQQWTTIPPRGSQYLTRRGGPDYAGGAPGTTIDSQELLTNGEIAPPQAAYRHAVPDPAPFDPFGLSWGAFTARPALEIDGGYDTNAARTPIKTPSWFQSVAPELLLNSNWQRHSLTATLRGSYTWFDNDHTLDRPTFEGRLNGRVDVTNDTRLDLETRFLVATDNPGSPNVQAGVAKFPINTTLGGTFGFDQRFNRLDISLKGLVDRTVYQESLLTDGTTSSNDDRNFNSYASQLRLNYELNPGLIPFTEFGVDTRVHDLLVDRNGLMRDSNGFFGRAGSTFEFTRILTGDVAVGWLMRDYRDPQLPELSGVTIDGSLTWLASALTTVKLIAKTTANETTVAGVAGTFTREATIEVDHAFRQWLIGTLRFTYDNDNYVGSVRNDDHYTAAASILYKLNREMQLKAEYRREWLHSTVPGVDYLSNVYLLGLRLQK